MTSEDTEGTNAQADLNLRWAYMSEGTFSYISSHVDYLNPLSV